MMSRTTLTKVGSEGDGRRPPETIFTAKALTKIYTSGEVEVPALRCLEPFWIEVTHNLRD